MFSHIFGDPPLYVPQMWDAPWRGTRPKVTSRCTLRRLGGDGELLDVFLQSWCFSQATASIFGIKHVFVCCFFVLDECKVYHYIQHVDSVNIYQVSRIAAIAISINQCYHIRIHFSMLRWRFRGSRIHEYQLIELSWWIHVVISMVYDCHNKHH